MKTASKSPEKRLINGYITGYVLSLYLTISAYLVVTHHMYQRRGAVAVLSLLAFVQFIVQMIFFLHLDAERKPRWKLYVFLFMSAVVLMVIFGSLWIMSHLNYMTPTQMEQYTSSQDGL